MMELEELTWDELFAEWKSVCHNYSVFKELLQPVLVNTVLIPKEKLGKQPFFIYGFDWLPISEYDKQTSSIVKDPLQWLYFGTATKKGTMTTAEFLFEAKNNEEKLAAIWISACVGELYKRLPDSWRGKGNKLLNSIQLAVMKFSDCPRWHHAMKDLVPDIILPYGLLGDIKPTSTRTILEVIAIICLFVVKNYKIVLYQTVLPDGSVITKTGV